jgi:hypothetical protein
MAKERYAGQQGLKRMSEREKNEDDRDVLKRQSTKLHLELHIQ